MTEAVPRPDRCQGRGEPFELVRDGDGWRRVFEKTSSWTWDEARLWSGEEVAAKVRAGTWRKVGAGKVQK